MFDENIETTFLTINLETLINFYDDFQKSI